MQEILGLKNKIINYVKQNGPVLPVQISKAIEKDILFAGAMLAELVKERLILISTAKIGGSPLYYVRGQEEKLQNLYDNLPDKEKEAFRLLKEKKILRDNICEPSIRVALRQIRDFAIPLKVNLQGNIEIFWKWYLTQEDETRNLVRQILGKKIVAKEKPKKEILEKPKRKRKPREIKPDEFLGQVSSHLSGKSIQIIEENVVRKNREIDMLIKVPSGLGVLDFFLNAKNKKRINDGDLSLAYHKGQSKKLPVLFLSTGDLTKKAKEYLEKNLKGYVVFKKI